MKSLLLIAVLAFANVFAMPCGAVSDIKQVSVQEANEAVGRAGVQFVDVRTPDEFKSGHAAKAVNIPLDVIEKESAALDKEKPVYLICRSGRRSQQAAETLKNAGFKEIYNVTGGTQAWTAANLPLEK